MKKKIKRTVNLGSSWRKRVNYKLFLKTYKPKSSKNRNEVGSKTQWNIKKMILPTQFSDKTGLLKATFKKGKTPVTRSIIDLCL